MLTADHGLDVLTEDHLGVGVVLRLHHVDRIVLIDASEAALGQLVGKTGTDHGGAVQTQDRIHGGIVDEVQHQLLGYRLGLAQAGLGVGDVDVIIDMAVVGGEMPVGEPQGDVAVLHRQKIDIDHSRALRLCQNKKKTSLGPGNCVSAGGPKNAFFNYIVSTVKIQEKIIRRHIQKCRRMIVHIEQKGGHSIMRATTT